MDKVQARTGSLSSCKISGGKVCGGKFVEIASGGVVEIEGGGVSEVSRSDDREVVDRNRRHGGNGGNGFRNRVVKFMSVVCDATTGQLIVHYH